MPTEENELTSYHFFATELDYKINTKKKKILSGNWCDMDSVLAKNLEKNIEVLKEPWEDINLREKDYLFIQQLLSEYCEKLTPYLNKYNNENFTSKFWKVLILPWLSWYFTSELYKWRIVNKALQEKKKISFYFFSEIKNVHPAIDTYSYNNLLEGNDEFNYLQFKKILKYLKNKGHEITFIEKLFNNKKEKILKKNILYIKIKSKIFDYFDKVILFFVKNNNIYIESDVFRKKDFLKINFLLRQFPTYFKKLFNYRIDNDIFENIKVNINKRASIKFDSKIQIKENTDFIEYINCSVRDDIPICFLEGFSNLKKSIRKINFEPKIILTAYQYFYSEKFKLWLAMRILKNDSKLITVRHGGGQHEKLSPSFDFDHRIAHKIGTWITPRIEKEIQLPANKFISFETKRKNYKNLSYVGSPAKSYRSHFNSKQRTLQSDLENLESLNANLDKSIWRNLIYLPSKIHISSQVSKIRNIVTTQYIDKPASLMEHLYTSKIVICSYPETSFLESLLTGPTILLYKLNYDSINQKFKKAFEDLEKNKVIFSSTEEASLHINQIWDNADEWWYSKNVKGSINDFIKQTCNRSDNAINIWVNFLKNAADKL